MKRFEISQTMKVATVWVAWAFLSVGALGWALFTVLGHFEVKEQAGWVQAIGGVLAIVGAAAFPYMHAADQLRRKEGGLRKLLHLLADNQNEQLKVLNCALRAARSDYGDKSISSYLVNGLHLKWPPHIEALRAIPIVELNPAQVQMLGELKVSADFAKGVIDRLGDWYVSGDREESDVKHLWHYQRLTEHIAGVLKQ